jgi:hypothetical protein
LDEDIALGDKFCSDFVSKFQVLGERPYTKQPLRFMAIGVHGVRIAKLQDFEWMRRDADLESTREDPRFKNLSGG